MIRLNQPYWHTIIPLTEHLAFIESIIGPFTGNQFAPWAPSPDQGAAGRPLQPRARPSRPRDHHRELKGRDMLMLH
jgi:hypothetical protein